MANQTAALVAALLLVQSSVLSAQVHEGQTIVTARLITDVSATQPGQSFTAGVHLTVAPGWHVYWENPGDTALPVEVQWQLPDDVTASPLRWPQPEKYQEDGGVTVFGYERETLLLAAIASPKTFAGTSMLLNAAASWLVCAQVCIPGEAALTLTVPIGKVTPSADAPTIQRFAAKVPAPGADAGVTISRARARRAGDRWTVTLQIDPRGLRLLGFFPRTIDGFTIDHGTIAVTSTTAEFSAEADDASAAVRRVSGVVVTDSGSFDVATTVTGADGIRPEVGASTPAESTRTPEAQTVTPARPSAEPSPSAALEEDDWLAQGFTTSAGSTDLPIATLLAFAALGGLLLNVMPCVLPVVSLKILGFVHQAGADPRKTRTLGLVFAAGVIVSFWILVGAVAAVRATGEQIGWGFQFQSVWFLLAMSVVVLVFAMSLFGVFEIAGPVLSGSLASGDGNGGAFVHGVLATVLATPCTAPFLGTALGFAFTQTLPILFLTFTAAAVGLALPYVILSFNPRLLRWLPRPGMWMIRFKQAMGFLLLATVVWLLSVLGSQLGPEGVVWTLMFLLVVAFAVWVIGQVPGTAAPSTRIAWRVAALALVVAGYVWALEIELRWRTPVAAATSDTVAAGGVLRWERFSLADVRQRVERGETVFVEFTADWCWSCKVNERTVLATSRVQTRMRELDVTPVRADWTKRNPEITRLLAKFGRVGVPYYVVFPAYRLTEPIALSEVITPGSVVDALDRAGPSQRQTTTAGRR